MCSNLIKQAKFYNKYLVRFDYSTCIKALHIMYKSDSLNNIKKKEYERKKNEQN